MESAFRSTWTRLLLAFTVLALSVGAFAQGGVGELSGILADSTGAVVSGVELKLSNTATGEVRTTVSTDSGLYHFAALPIVGTYTLEVTSKGFKSTKVQNIIVSVGTITSRDVKLEIGAATEQVTVEAGAQLVQTEESAISQLIDRRIWQQMPLEARSANDFINLVAGAVPEQFDRTFRGAAVNGTRTGTGNYMVEGVDNNEQGQGGVAICGTACGQGGANTSISPDAIQEYRVITHDFAAEYGKAGGFVTDTVLKGGTNQWHGTAFEYNRIQALAANDYFSNRDGVQDHLVRNQFGGSFGGPIIKDKTFFYASFEGQHLRQAQPVTGTSFTQQFYDFVNSGAFETFIESSPNGVCVQDTGSACPGAFSKSATVGPNFKAQLAQFPLAMPLVNSKINCATDTTGACVGQGVYTGQAIFGIGAPVTYPVPIYDSATEANVTPINQYRFSVKVDHKLSANDQINATYLFENVHFRDSFGAGDATFGPPTENPNRAQTLGITLTHTFSPTVLNQLKGGYSRRTANFTSPGTDGIPSQITIDALSGGFGASTSFPQFFTENQFQVKDDISVTKGKHSFKFGGEYRRTRNGSSFEAAKNGEFWYWSGEDLITDGTFTDQADHAVYGYYGAIGSWYRTGAAVVPSTGALPAFYRGYRANEVAMYGQDDWRVTPRLTVNLGLRWEYFGPPHNFQPNIDSNFYFGNPVTPIAGTHSNPFFPASSPFYASEATGAFQVHNSSIWNKDLNNFGPRVGFAWDVLGNQKLVLRSGFGLFYDRLYNNIFENIRFNPPYYCECLIGVLQNGVPSGPLVPGDEGLYTNPFTSTSAFASVGTKARPRHIDQDLTTPYYEQWSMGLQYQLAKDFALEANYIGTAGRHLLGVNNINTFDGRLGCSNGPYAAGDPCFDAGFPNGYSTARPNTTIGSDNFRSSSYLSNYHAVNLTVRKRFSQGLQFNANYTYAKALDELSDVFRAKGSTGPSDPMNPHLDYGPSDFDIRHRFVFSPSYDLPFMKDNRWLGGWSVNSIFSWSTGAPIALLDSVGDPNQSGVTNQRPSFYGPGSPTSYVDTNVSPANGFIRNPLSPNNPDPTGNGQVFGPVLCPASVNDGIWCNSNLGRGTLHGPHFINLDFGVNKSFRITEGSKVTFMANFFDLANHPNFENPNANVSDPAFGKSQTTFGDNGGHRVTQLALRFDF